MKVLIELPTWLGDTVMATPAIENLISYYSKIDITLIGQKSSIELLQNLKHVNKLQYLEKSYLSIYKASKKLGMLDWIWTNEICLIKTKFLPLNYKQ